MTENDSIRESAQHEEVTSTSITPTISVQQPSTSATISNSPRSPAPRSRKSTLRSPTNTNIVQEGEETGWGSNFWVTLVDPQVCSIALEKSVSLKIGSISESDCIFCMSCYGRSQLGTPSWYFCVNSSIIEPFMFLIFVHRLPPSDDGEWWELSDESRGGLPYYYQTKTGETVWEKPNGFVIPLSILQVSYTAKFYIPG